MRWFIRHPGERELNRYADGALEDREHARVSTHLADCPRCREEVALIRRIADTTRTIPTPLATDEVLRRALARRAAGERVLLPMSDAGAPRPVGARRYAPAAIAAMLTLMVAGLVFSVRVLEADRPALRLTPERPTAGEALTVEYHGGALFADQTHLALRARYRTADDRHWQLLAGVLTRGPDGLYRSEVQLPDSVVYAAFAVEDFHGQRVDSNNRELWDVMAHGEDDRPTLDAMYARLRDLEGRDWGAAYEMARAMTLAYPDAPQSWATRFSFELSLFDRDSIFGAHSDHFARLERAMVEGSQQDAKAMAWLGLYGLDLGDMDSAELWIERAMVSGGEAPQVADVYAVLLVMRHAAEPSLLLTAMEQLWGQHRSTVIAHGGWQAAIAAGDSEAILRWSDRYVQERPAEGLMLVPAAYATAELRPRLVSQVREFLSGPERWNRAERPLHLPIDAHVRAHSTIFQQAVAAGAAVTAAAGDSSHARALAELGVDLAWDSDALLRFAQILWRSGSPEPALDALARAEADPATAAAARTAPWATRTADWPERLQTARRQLRDHVMDDAVIRYLREDPRLTLEEARPSFSSLHGGRPTVVVFLSRYCAPALDDAQRLPVLTAALEEMGAQLVVVSVESTSEVEDYVGALGYEGPVYRDDRGEARSAFQSSKTADFFVMDASGRVRFEHSAPEEVLRQVWAIRDPAGAFPVITD